MLSANDQIREKLDLSDYDNDPDVSELQKSFEKAEAKHKKKMDRLREEQQKGIKE